MKNTLIIFGITAAFFTACTNKTTLTYQAVLEEKPKNDIEVKLLDFQDRRPAKDLIGHFRNEYGIPSVKLIARNDVAKWSTSALREELERSGFTVKGFGSDVETEIRGDIYDLYCDTGGYYNGRMTIKLKVKRNGELLFKKKYHAKEDNGFVWLANAKSSTKAIEMNMQSINREIVDDLTRNVFGLSN